MKLVDSISINTPKNILQFLIGFSLYLLVYGSFNPIKLIFGLSSFIIAYSAIYPYNDLMDYESDKKNKFKQVYKALVRGDLKHSTAITLVFGLPIIGLLLASYVSTWYMILLILLLFMNFLYSSPYTRLKSKMKTALPIMFLIQMLKFSMGWFTFTTNISLMPYWIIITLSLSYMISYVLYKKNVINMKKTFVKHKKLMIPLSISTLASYYISIVIYPYKLPLLLLFPLVMIVFVFSKVKDATKKTFKLSGFTFTLLGIIAFALFLLNVPLISAINERTSDAIDNLGEATLQAVNNETYEVICQINETLYSYPIHDLRELENWFNITELEVIIKK